MEVYANLIEENNALKGTIDNFIVSASADPSGASAILYQRKYEEMKEKKEE